MRRLAILLALFSVFTACSLNIRVPVVEGSARKASNSKWIDVEAMNTAIAPADDFYRFVNGNWVEQTEIPETLPWISPYVRNYFLVRERLKKIVTRIDTGSLKPGSDRKRLANLYRSFMDVTSIEARGLTPLEPLLQRIDDVRSLDDLAIVFAEINRRHFRPGNVRRKYAAPFVIVARPDDRNSSMTVATLRPAGLGLFASDAYINDQTQLRSAYRTHIEKMLRLSGIIDAASQAENVLALETSLAKAMNSLTSGMSHQENYQRISFSRLREMTPSLDWGLYLKRAGVGTHHEFVVKDSGYFQSLEDILVATPLATWRAWLRWQVLRVYAPYLGESWTDEYFSFYGRVQMGRDEPMAREKQAIIFVEQAFPDLLGRLYIEQHLSADTKARVTDMVEQIRLQYAESIRNLEWMSDSTRKAALEKLDKMIIKVGYPDHWRTYDGLDIAPDQLIANVMALNEASYNSEIAHIGKAVDRTIWQVPVYANSAYYYRLTNELAIPAGYLLPPWFDPDADAAMNYGGIGTVIGHEMGHAFDNQGSQYDGDGNLRNWWTPEDRKRFAARTHRLVAQYNEFSPAPGKYVDGELTLSENIGDLVGVTMAYQAFKAKAANDLVREDARFSPEQRFFISYAMHWRAKYRESLLDRILKGDGHSPQKYRANGPLRNFTPFYEAFGVGKEDGMFLPPEERVSIW